MLAVSCRVVLVADLPISKMIAERSLRFLPVDDLTAGADKPTNKFGIIPHNPFIVELLKTLMFMDDSFWLVYFRIALA